MYSSINIRGPGSPDRGMVMTALWRLLRLSLALAGPVAAFLLMSTPAQADDGISTVVTPIGEPANLRPCPGPAASGAHDCGVIGQIDSGTSVREICWESGRAPTDGRSRKWFYVTVVEGPMAGTNGYVWADFV